MNKVKLKDVCEAMASNIAQKDISVGNGDYPIYGASGFIGNVDFYKQEKPYIGIVKDGAGVGRAYLLPEKSSVIGTMQYILPKDNIDIKYLYYAIQYMHLEKYYSGATIPHIYFRDYQYEPILLPGKKEQEQKTNVLEKIDKLVFMHKKTLRIIDTLVKSRFIEMFGDININNKNWPIKPLGELCDIYRGGSPRPINKFLGGDVPWIKIGDATKGDEIYLHSTKEHIIKDGVKKSRMVKSGSLIFANCGVSLGFARIITFDGCIHDGWLAFEDIDESLDKVFLLLSLNQLTEYFRAIAPDGTQPNLNTAIMKMHQQIIPPIKLQRQFVEFVRQADKSKLAVQQSIETLQTLKEKLMQDYFG